MKTKFNTYDLVCSVTELQKLIGMRVNQIYDIDNKTYLIRLQRSEEKSILLLESGSRIHTTAFEWPKNVAPSGFSMKMRKHLKNKRLESLKQIGVDRIVDLQFGTGEVAYHVILELYDRGNIVLSDHEMNILYLLRPHTEGDKIRLAVREKYPAFRAQTKVIVSREELVEIMSNRKPKESLKKILNPHLQVGAAVIDHILLEAGFPPDCKMNEGFNLEQDLDKLYSALVSAENMLTKAQSEVSRGFIIRKEEPIPTSQEGEEKKFLYANVEFHPFLFEQHKNSPYAEYETFDKAVDEYFSSMEGQKLDLKALQQEREVLKKLENVKKDQSKRLISLTQNQEEDKIKAELINRNQQLVDNAILAIRSALANQISWENIKVLLQEAKSKGDVVASAIKQLKLESNQVSMLLKDPYVEEDEEELPVKIVDINLNLSAFANARKYYNMKRSAAQKEKKTIESQSKALKSAERKAKQTLKEVQAIHSINKARKTYWFEKFFWFISSENYLIIGGRDQQQNELIVKRYLRAGDLYVHADLSGASSIVIKNPSGGPVPPKTIAEAGSMAVAYSIAWEAKVIAGAWWVHSDQVSKTAPSGEYLTTGSFMIRGKKNYLPPCPLVMGIGFLFRLEDSFIEAHKNERREKTLEEAKDDDIANNTESFSEIDLEDDNKNEDESLDPIQEESVDNVEEESSDDKEDDSLFPDTRISFDLTGEKVKLCVDEPAQSSSNDIDDIVFLGDDKPVILNTGYQRKVKKGNQKKNSNKKVEIKEVKEEEPNKVGTKPGGLKRGQKGKLKKMKEKYKDQDEEDKKLFMMVLQSGGSSKESKSKPGQKDPAGPSSAEITKKTATPKNALDQNNVDNDDVLADENAAFCPDVDMLDQLTGKPFAEDELLFAVPVVAPYSTLQSYKFKIKLIPGTGKRGKAAKTALAVLLKEKTITSREKDLLKSVKDEIIARNIPGKVKISAPQINQKFKNAH